MDFVENFLFVFVHILPYLFAVVAIIVALWAASKLSPAFREWLDSDVEEDRTEDVEPIDFYTSTYPTSERIDRYV